MTQWESGLLITSKKFPCHYLRLKHTGKKHQLHLQARSDLWPLLFAFSHQNYVRYLTQHHVELTNLSFTKPQAFSDIEIFGWKTVTSRLVGQVWEAAISWLWESILSGTVINSQTLLRRKSQKIWNRDLSISFELFDVSYYKRVQLSLTWIFECFNYLEEEKAERFEIGTCLYPLNCLMCLIIKKFS